MCRCVVREDTCDLGQTCNEKTLWNQSPSAPLIIFGLSHDPEVFLAVFPSQIGHCVPWRCNRFLRALLCCPLNLAKAMPEDSAAAVIFQPQQVLR
eukprot:s2248_g14.t1